MKTLYFGGPVLTMDQSAPFAEALLCEDGKILAAGRLSDLENVAGGAKKRDLGGLTLMPAFVDGHSHMAGEGLYTLKCDLLGSGSFDEIRARILAYREKRNLTHGELILCRGYDLGELKEGRHPTREALDVLPIDNPVVCTHQSGHMLCANSAMLRYCGVDDAAETPAGGFIGRDAAGHLTGYFEEKAQALISGNIPANTDEEVENAIVSVQQEYFAGGITTIQDGSGNQKKRLDLYHRLGEAGKLKADVVVYMGAKAGPALWKETAEKYGNREYRGHVKIGGVKIVLDGSPQARTAWMKDPYEGEKDYRAYPCFPDGFVNETLLKASEMGIQVLAHCNGDAAAAQFVNAVELAAEKVPAARRLRHEMIHCQTAADAELDRMANLGMVASVFVGHCWFFGDTHLKNFGPVRGNRISPAKQCLDRGIPYNFHQDSPVTKPNMLHSVWCAVNRLTKGGVSIGPEYRLSAAQALWGATRGGAYAYFEEERKGILKPGAAEDLILLDKNPLAVDPMAIRDLKIRETIKDGETVFIAE